MVRERRLFVVLDEDEFAKTLIPELFKHNNYASFVRQLNMYGFHKRVGLSDNSMKASERKTRAQRILQPVLPARHPNLLWLINKQKVVTRGRRAGRMMEMLTARKRWESKKPSAQD